LYPIFLFSFLLSFISLFFLPIVLSSLPFPIVSFPLSLHL
jgi:hypothetical protein